MPRDKRLWMTFPIDMHRHPKINRLTVTARWAFFEMNGEARLLDNDGVFPIADADHQWTRRVMDQLVGSHPTRPLVTRDESFYRIRDYAEHQETRADREARSEQNRLNGAKGGRPPKNRPGYDSVAGRLPAGSDSLANKTQSQSLEIEIDRPRLSQSGQEPNRASSDDKTDEVNVEAVIVDLASYADITATVDEATEYARFVIAHAKGHVRNHTSYVLTTIYNSQRECAEWFNRHRRHLKAVGDV